MTLITEQERKHYIRNIWTLMPIHTKQEKKYIKYLKTTIEERAQQDDSLTIEDIKAEFGEPEDIVHDYIDSIDTDLLIKKISSRERIRKISNFLIVVALIGAVIYTIYTYVDYVGLKNSLISEEVTIIEYGGSE